MNNIFKMLYINFYILILNWKKKINVTNYLKRDLERKILFRHIININKENNLSYNIESIGKLEILSIKNKLDFINLDDIIKYELLNQEKKEESNVVNLSEYRKKKLKKRYK